jgi:hypothetical protein
MEDEILRASSGIQVGEVSARASGSGKGEISKGSNHAQNELELRPTKLLPHDNIQNLIAEQKIRKEKSLNEP